MIVLRAANLAVLFPDVWGNESTLTEIDKLTVRKCEGETARKSPII